MSEAFGAENMILTGFFFVHRILAPDEGGMFKKKDALQEQRRRNLGEVIDRLRRENGEVPVKQDRMSMLFTRKP